MNRLPDAVLSARLRTAHTILFWTVTALLGVLLLISPNWSAHPASANRADVLTLSGPGMDGDTGDGGGTALRSDTDRLEESGGGRATRAH
jgi:hypothetical protein